MREATDLAISAGIRRELSGRRIDLTKLKFPVKAGVVSLQGELCFVGLEKTTDETAVELKFIESSLKKLPGVKEIVFELTNWSKNDSGLWETSSAIVTSTGSSAPILDGDGLVCPDCDYVIRFCPCCGKPLAGAGRSSAAHPRKTALPVRPIIKKKRPASPLFSPVLKPAMPGAPVIQAPDVLKKFQTPVAPVKPVAPTVPAIGPASQATNQPARSPEPVKPAVQSVTPPKPAILTPSAPQQPPTTATPIIQAKPAIPAAPAQARPATPSNTGVPPTRQPITPVARPVTPASGHPMPATGVTPISPAKSAPVPAPAAAPAKPPIQEKVPEEEEISAPDFDKFTLSADDIPSENTDEADLANLFGSLKTELPGAGSPAVQPHPPAAQAVPARTVAPAKPLAAVPDFNFDALISGSESDGSLSDSGNAPNPQGFDTPAFDLGSLGDLESNPADSDVPEGDEDTPLPPMRQAQPSAPAGRTVAPAKPAPANVFEDDDTPLPPMKPATPAGKDAKESKDLFASLFSDTDLNLGLPADGSGHGKNPFGNLDLELDVLEVFPGNDEPAPPPTASPGKKPPAPAKPAPADDNPFNLDNVIDLDSPVEEKSPSKKKGTKDPFDLDDFDISKFKL